MVVTQNWNLRFCMWNYVRWCHGNTRCWLNYAMMQWNVRIVPVKLTAQRDTCNHIADDVIILLFSHWLVSPNTNDHILKSVYQLMCLHVSLREWINPLLMSDIAQFSCCSILSFLFLLSLSYPSPSFFFPPPPPPPPPPHSSPISWGSWPFCVCTGRKRWTKDPL